MLDRPEDSNINGFSEAALEQLRTALARDGLRPPSKGSPVHGAIRTLVEEARRHGTPVEQVIIQLKAEWVTLGLAARTGPRSDGAVIIQRLVTLCLDEYFAAE